MADEASVSNIDDTPLYYSIVEVAISLSRYDLTRT